MVAGRTFGSISPFSSTICCVAFSVAMLAFIDPPPPPGEYVSDLDLNKINYG